MKKYFDIFPKFIKENITASWKVAQKEAVYESFPDLISDKTKEIFKILGITHLYKHQAESINHTYSGNNVVIVTGTGSGKSLCYQIPIVDSLFSNCLNSSLLLFPTKALSMNQFNIFYEILSNYSKKSGFGEKASIGIYDGDTPKSQRISMRNSVNVLITNPDMLHIGILPHHPAWRNYLSNLKFIVIDEIHVYTGVFGSNFTNVIRRLKRILDFYGSTPKYILTSATIGNPKQLASNILEEEIELVETDWSNQNAKNYIFYNPPVINEELGVRKSMREETYNIAKYLLARKIQMIIFARTRNSVEQLLKIFNTRINKNQISAYRSGFLKKERREIEASLKSRTLDLVISTTALELGIDIGTVEAIILMGYPGSVSKFFQQAGRAGRGRNNPSLCVMIASSSPLDQFFIRHPEFIREKNPEMVLVDPNNVFLLFNHLKCAAFELPFSEGDNFGTNNWGQLHQYFSIFEKIDILYKSKTKYFWKSNQYPAKEISLRSISGNPFMLFANENGSITHIGEVDNQSVKRMLYPGAVYLHNGQPFQVISLDFDKHIANLLVTDDYFYTEPVVNVTTEIMNLSISKNLTNHKIFYGDIKINETIVGFNRICWDTREIIGYEDLNLESDELLTKAIWLTFSDEIVNYLIKLNLWTNTKNNYGVNWDKIRKEIIARDHNICQLCGLEFSSQKLHVHHKQPIRPFISSLDANQDSNLISLCPTCHRVAEMNIRMRSVLSGLTFGFSQLVPLFLSCDIHDLGYCFEEKIGAEKRPGIFIYDQFPGGIGLSENLFSQIENIFRFLKDIVNTCPCLSGCPSCIGPPGENGVGAKTGVLELITSIGY